MEETLVKHPSPRSCVTGSAYNSGDETQGQSELKSAPLPSSSCATAVIITSMNSLNEHIVATMSKVQGQRFLQGRAVASSTTISCSSCPCAAVLVMQVRWQMRMRVPVHAPVSACVGVCVCVCIASLAADEFPSVEAARWGWCGAKRGCGFCCSPRCSGSTAEAEAVVESWSGCACARSPVSRCKLPGTSLCQSLEAVAR